MKAKEKKYSEKLKDRRWQKKRLEVNEKNDWKCQWCGSEDDSEQLHVHHAYYQKNREPWDYPDDCFYSLCKKCHDKATQLQNRLKQVIGLVPPWKQEELLQNLSKQQECKSSLGEGEISAIWRRLLGVSHEEDWLKRMREVWFQEFDSSLYAKEMDRATYDFFKNEIWEEANEIVVYWARFYLECSLEECSDEENNTLFERNDNDEIEILPEAQKTLAEVLAGLTLSTIIYSGLLDLPKDIAATRIRAYMRIASAWDVELSLELYGDRWGTLNLLLRGMYGPYSAKFLDRKEFATDLIENIKLEKRYMEAASLGGT